MKDYSSEIFFKLLGDITYFIRISSKLFRLFFESSIPKIFEISIRRKSSFPELQKCHFSKVILLKLGEIPFQTFYIV